MNPTEYEAQYHNSWALIIGINLYSNMAELNYACNDADAVASILVNDLGFPTNQVFILKDNQATKQQIIRDFHSFNRKADHPDDRLIVFYAGHGLTVPGIKGDVGFLAPVDCNPDDTSTLIRWDDLTRNAELIKAKHILFIMDACYSGLAMQRGTPISKGTRRFLRDMLQRPARQVITAGKKDQVVADGGGESGQNSIFTGHLIKGLRGKAIDENGILTASRLMNYVYTEVSQDSRSSQTPHYGHIEGDGDFILITPNNTHLTNQQPEFLVKSVPENPEVNVASEISSAKPNFAIKNGYGDPEHPNFGRNDWAEKLGEFRYDNTNTSVEKAYSWLSLIIEPATNQPISLNIRELTASPLRTTKPRPEFEQFHLPQQSLTTMNALIFYDQIRESNYWGHYLRIDRNGNIEYVSSDYPIFHVQGEARLFSYVSIIGKIWQFMFLAKDILDKADYGLGVEFFVNLVGTRDSILHDFSTESGEGNNKWKDPAWNSFRIRERLPTCLDLHLQMKYRIVLADLNEQESKKVVRDAAEQLGLAYNIRGEPRCFNYKTDIFPWAQYFRNFY